MAFTVNDLEDLLALLRQHPQWRAAVRQEVLGEELLALPDLVRQNSVDIQKLTERMDQLAGRMDQLADRMDQLTERMDQLAERVDQLTERIDQLAGRMDQLTTAVEKLVGRADKSEVRLGRMSGQLLELWYQHHPGVLARLHGLRRPRSADLSTMDSLSDAAESGLLSDDDLNAIYLLDVVVLGRVGSGDDARDAVLAVEISSKIDMYDVRRAEERARILSKAGYTVYPVVAGHEVDDLTRRYLDERDIRYDLRPDEEEALAS